MKAPFDQAMEELRAGITQAIGEMAPESVDPKAKLLKVAAEKLTDGVSVRYIAQYGQEAYDNLILSLEDAAVGDDPRRE